MSMMGAQEDERGRDQENLMKMRSTMAAQRHVGAELENYLEAQFLGVRARTHSGGEEEKAQATSRKKIVAAAGATIKPRRGGSHRGPGRKKPRKTGATVKPRREGFREDPSEKIAGEVGGHS